MRKEQFAAKGTHTAPFSLTATQILSKKAARKEAWFNNYNAEENKVYNPFSRVNTRRVQPIRDEEHGGNVVLSRVNSENNAMSPVEEARRREESKSTLPILQKASTLPQGSSGGLPESNYRKSDEIPTGESTVKLGVPELITPLEKLTPRKRKFHVPWKSSEKDDEIGGEREKIAQKKKYPKISLGWQLKVIFLGSWTMLLLPFVPAGFAVYYTYQSVATAFVINFLAIIPTNSALVFAVDELSKYVGDKLQGILSMTFSNAVQLISSILLLKTRQIAVLQASLLGSILQNILLMGGLAFLLGGVRYEEQYFNSKMAQTISMFLLLAVLSLTVPTLSRLWGHSTTGGILAQSRGTAVVVMVSYALWMVFQLKTNRAMFENPEEKTPPAKPWPHARKSAGTSFKALAFVGAGTGAAAVGGAVHKEKLVTEIPDDDDAPQLGRIAALLAAVIFTTLLAFNVQFATDSIQGLMTTHGLSDSFMGIVILPLLSNDPATLTVAVSDKMDLGLALTLERAMQTALMVVPLIVLIAWGMHVDSMTLDFDGFSVASLFASIIVVTYVVQEGRSNWLMGALLVKIFIIIAVASYYIH